MSRGQKQRRRAGGRKAVNAKGTAKGLPARTYNEAMRPDGAVGGPKGPRDPGARVVHWGT